MSFEKYLCGQIWYRNPDPVKKRRRWRKNIDQKKRCSQNQIWYNKRQINLFIKYLFSS